MVTIFAGRDLPLYPGRIQNEADLLHRFAWGQSKSVSLLTRWPVDTLFLDTTATPHQQLMDTLLGRIGLR